MATNETAVKSSILYVLYMQFLARLKLCLVYISIYIMGSSDDAVKKALDKAKALEKRAGIPPENPTSLESLPTLILGELDAQGYVGYILKKLAWHLHLPRSCVYKNWLVNRNHTPLKFNMDPENWRWEDEFPFKKRLPFFEAMLNFRGVCVLEPPHPFATSWIFKLLSTLSNWRLRSPEDEPDATAHAPGGRLWESFWKLGGSLPIATIVVGRKWWRKQK